MACSGRGLKVRALQRGPCFDSESGGLRVASTYEYRWLYAIRALSKELRNFGENILRSFLVAGREFRNWTYGCLAIKSAGLWVPRTGRLVRYFCESLERPSLQIIP